MAHRLERSPLFVGLFVMLVVACSRTPPEPTPTATTSEPRKATAPSTSGALTTTTSRCISQVPAAAAAIPPPADSSMCPADPEPNLKMPMGEVTFPDAPSSPRVEVELAKAPHHVERG